MGQTRAESASAIARREAFALAELSGALRARLREGVLRALVLIS